MITMPTGLNVNEEIGKLIKSAARAKIVIGGSICVGELLMWNSDPVCFLFENEQGERAMESFADTRAFVKWLEGHLGAGHNIRFAPHSTTFR